MLRAELCGGTWQDGAVGRVDLPPFEDVAALRNEHGADLVTFSGGKALRGPQASGFILGRKDLIEACRRAVPTETQVMVKREDEQAFAELNAANPIFVEDAARLFAEQLQADPRIGDYRVLASHQESLHSHDAVSVLTEGETFASESIDPRLFSTLFAGRSML